MGAKSLERCKTLMMVFNILFLLGGLALVGLGIWIAVDYASFTDILSANIAFYNATYIIIGVGAGIVVLSFCGLCGAWKENKCLLTVFVVVLLILLVAEVVALVMAFAFSSTLVEVLRNAARFSMSLYGSNPAVTFAWDYTQTTFSCCGFDNGSDYQGTSFDSTSASVQPWPESCCVRMSNSNNFVDRDACLSSAASPANSNDETGCHTTLEGHIRTYWQWIVGVTAGVMTIQLLAIIFACCVMSNIGRNKVGQWA